MKLIQLLFGCTHKNYSWPHGKVPYVVCLDCGKEIPYSIREMRKVA